MGAVLQGGIHQGIRGCLVFQIRVFCRGDRLVMALGDRDRLLRSGRIELVGIPWRRKKVNLEGRVEILVITEKKIVDLEVR